MCAAATFPLTWGTNACHALRNLPFPFAAQADVERLNKCTQDKTVLAAAIARRCAEDDAQHEVRAVMRWEFF
jgi:hypothetical protein